MMKEFDWNKVALLTHIANELRGHPRLDKMLKAAEAQLEEMCKDPEAEKAKEVEVVKDTAIQPSDLKPKETQAEADARIKREGLSERRPPGVDPAAASEPPRRL